MKIQKNLKYLVILEVPENKDNNVDMDTENENKKDNVDISNSEGSDTLTTNENNKKKRTWTIIFTS